MKKIINPYIGAEQTLGYNCFGCAPGNPHGLRMEFYEDGDEVVSLWKPESQFQGWLDTLHGGIQACLVDETASWLVSRKKQLSGMTTNLNISYRKPISTASEQPIEIRARIREEKRNFIFINVTITANGEVCSKAELTFFCFSKKQSVDEFHFRPVQTEEEMEAAKK